MKNFRYKLSAFLILMLSVVTFLSCSDDDSAPAGTEPPIITEVNATLINGIPAELAPVTSGFANNMYVIRGSGLSTVQNIYFNDTESYFNPTLVTDNAIFVTIDRDTPYFETIDELRVVTKNGTAIFSFVVLPAPPIIASYNSINAAAGETVTIYGQYFLDPVVTVGETEAVVTGSSVSEITFIMPADSNLEYVTVETQSGSATATQAVGTAIYDDATASFVENYLGPWDGSGFTIDTDIKIQGQNSIKATYTGYTGFKFPMYASSPSTTGYSGIRVSVKSTKESGKFLVVLNNNFAAGKQIEFTSAWTTFFIPFAELGGAPANINEIVFQEFGNAGGDIIYIDDLGFVLE
jgi:hypothetical protein